MYNASEGVRPRWAYPRDNERNIVAGLLHLGSVIVTTWALVSLDWFRVFGGDRCTPKLPLHLFISPGFFRTMDRRELTSSDEVVTLPVEYNTGFETLACVTPEVLNLMRVLILLCLISIFCSMVGFCLDVMGPTKKPLRFIRRNALPGIWTVLAVVCIIGVCYLVTRMLEFGARGRTPIHVSYENGCYAVTAAGAISLLATACNLLQDPPPATVAENPVARHRLMEDFEGLETFSVGMHSLPPPPPYTP